MTKKQEQEQERQEAITKLLEILTPGQTVYTIIRHVSSSGMSRSISVVVGCTDSIGKVDAKGVDFYIESLDYWIARACDLKIDQKNGGLKIGGCGMDMGFHLVYNLGRTLWPDGTPKPHGRRNSKPDSDGGYALKQRWL